MSVRRIPWGAISLAATVIGMASVGFAYHRSLISTMPATPLTASVQLHGVGDLVLAWTSEPALLIAYDARGETWRSDPGGTPVRVLDGDPLLVEMRDPDRWIALDRATGRQQWTVPAACRADVVARDGVIVAVACGRRISVMIDHQWRWTQLVPGNVTALGVGDDVIAAVAGDRSWVLDPTTGVVLAEHLDARVIHNGARAALVIDRQDGRDEHLRIETLERVPTFAELPADTTSVVGDPGGPIVLTSSAVMQGDFRVAIAEPGTLVWSGSAAALLVVRDPRACHARVVDLPARHATDLGAIDCDASRVLAAASSRALIFGERGGTTITVLDRTRARRTTHPLLSASGSSLAVHAFAFSVETLWLTTADGVRCLGLAALVAADGQPLRPQTSGCEAVP